MLQGGMGRKLARTAFGLAVLGLPFYGGTPATSVEPHDAAKLREVMLLIETHPHPMVRLDMLEAIESGRMTLSFDRCEWDSTGERVRAQLTRIVDFSGRRYVLNFCPEFFVSDNTLMHRYGTVLHEWVHLQQFEVHDAWYDRTVASLGPKASARASFEREVEASAAAAKFICLMEEPDGRSWLQSLYCNGRNIPFRRQLAKDLSIDPRFREHRRWIQTCAQRPWSRFPTLSFL